MKRILRITAAAVAALMLVSCGRADMDFKPKNTLAPRRTTTTTVTTAAPEISETEAETEAPPAEETKKKSKSKKTTTTTETTTTAATTTAAMTTTTAAQTTVKPADPEPVKLPFKQEDFTGLPGGVTTTVSDKTIVQTGSVNGVSYSFTIDLSGWEKNTTKEQIVVLAQLFWQSYPKMYARFGSVSGASTTVTLAIENSGYEVAETAGNRIHLHDKWLSGGSTDYDCITHELAHVIQNGWNANYLGNIDYIERFADYCRFVYALDNGYYNDACWTLQTADTESSLNSSVRFLVWLDYMYSTGGNMFSSSNDLLLKYFRICSEKKYFSTEWDAAWQEIFEGSDLEGISIDEAWELYVTSDFAYYSSESYQNGGVSELLSYYDIRAKLDP